MRLIVLGRRGPYPTAEEPCSGYLIENDAKTEYVLLDCGPGVLMNLQKVIPIEALGAVVLSHLHYDHMSDMLPMHYLLQFHPPVSPLKVYAPEEPGGVADLLKGANTQLLSNAGSFTVGSMRFQTAPMRHPMPSSAIAVDCDGKRLVYTGDTNTAPGLEAFCDHADLLLADAGLSKEDYSEKAPHLSAALCGKLAADCGAKRLLLTHFNPKYDIASLEREARAYDPGAEAAQVLQVYSL